MMRTFIQSEPPELRANEVVDLVLHHEDGSFWSVIDLEDDFGDRETRLRERRKRRLKRRQDREAS